MNLHFFQPTFGEALQHVLDKLRISQTELAKFMGVDSSLVSRIANSRSTPRKSTVEKIQKGFIKAGYFVTFEQNSDNDSDYNITNALASSWSVNISNIEIGSNIHALPADKMASDVSEMVKGVKIVGDFYLKGLKTISGIEKHYFDLLSLECISLKTKEKILDAITSIGYLRASYGEIIKSIGKDHDQSEHTSSNKD